MKTILAVFCLFAQSLAQESLRYEIRDISLNDRDSVSYEIVGEYPLIVGLSDTTLQSRINKRIQSLVYAWIQEFKDQAAEAYTRYRNSPYRFISSIDIGCIRRGAPTDSVLSLAFANMGLVRGDAHDYTQYATLTFDLLTGQPIELHDIFEPDSHYLDTLSKYCISNILAQKRATEPFPQLIEGASPKANSFKYFFLERDQLTLFFDPYQVDSFGNAPHGYEVEIPYESLRRVLKRSGPLNGLFR